MTSDKEDEQTQASRQLEQLAAEQDELLERLSDLEKRAAEESSRRRAAENALRLQAEAAEDALGRLSRLEGSRELTYGRALAAATRSARSALRLPREVLRARRLSPAKVSRADRKPPRARLTSGRSYLQSRRSSETERLSALGSRLAEALDKGERLRVAGIVDDFTRKDLSLECDFIDLHPDTWTEQIASHAPHLVFVESAWRGKDDTWYGAVAAASKELLGILAHCREAGIASVYWAKEDPIHMHSFMRVAQECDFVFTTDIDCIGRYKKILGHDRVSLLPFANQPRAHHPLETYERTEGLVFAGSYYRRFPERNKALNSIFRAVREHFPFDIYDRNFELGRPEFAFPPDFLPRVKGTLPASEIDRAYKGYTFSLNLNSITQSQSMFARRVFELMASNTLVVSNYARGMVNFFGELLVASDDGAECLSWMQELASDPLRADRLRLAALRKVMREHTYTDRLEYIVSRVTGREFSTYTPRVTVLAAPTTEAELASVLESAARQRGVVVDLVLVGGPQVPGASLPGHVAVTRLDSASASRVGQLARPGSVAVGFFDPEDWYGEHYLLDAALTWRYAPTLEAAGKQRHFALAEGSLVDVPGRTYVPVDSLDVRRSLVAPSSKLELPTGEISTWIREGSISSGEMVSIDRFSYVAGGADAEDGLLVDAGELELDGGMPMSELLSLAESAAPERRTREAPGDLTGKSLHRHVARLPRESGLRVRAVREGIEIRSRAPRRRSEVVYLAKRFGVLAHWPSGVAELYLEASSTAEVRLRVNYLDHRGRTISSSTVRANRDISLPIPAGTVELQLGVKVPGASRTTVHGVLLRHHPVRPALHLAHARTLVVSSYYPSPEALYSNAFVHSRVKGYRARGERVEVFTPQSEGTSFRSFDGVEVVSAPVRELRRLLESGAYERVGVHFLNRATWRVLREFADRVDITVWVHGVEIQPWWRRSYVAGSPATLEQLKAKSEKRQAFWREVLDELPDSVRFAVVSRHFLEEIEEDLGRRFPPGSVEVIHNPIDTELFAFAPKPPDQRHKVLSIRPFASGKYANDLTVAAILELSTEPWFDELQFRIVGDGPLFDEVTAPVSGLRNVELVRGFLSQSEIAQLHREYGVFLVPTRMDAQGVSRDEAMASGLVPITNAVAAVPEFVDEQCGILAPAEDAHGLADGIRRLHEDPELFARLSVAAAERVRRQSAADSVIPQELELLSRARRSVESSR